MKFTQAIAIGALGCISFAASAQEQQTTIQPSPQTPIATTAVATQPAVGGPVLLNLTGVTVTDAAGQPIGPVQHILLSPAGCVDMAVMSLGGQKLVAVPWQLIGGSGVARGETDVASSAAFALKVDRAVLQQAPTITLAQLSHPQVVEQSRVYFAQFQQPGTAAGGTTSQTGVNVGVGAGATATNRGGVGVTNAGAGIGVTNRTTNQTGILSPTGPTNAVPGRPAFQTNRPTQPSTQPSIIPPGRQDGRLTNPPPASTPGAPGVPPRSGQP